MKTITKPVSAVQFGILTSVEMATAMLVYIPVAYLADKSTKKPFVAITFAFFTFFPLALVFCRSFEWLLFAFILRGLKEFGEPTRKSLIMDLAPENCKAGMFGLYYLLRDIFVSAAAFGGALLWQISPSTNFMVAFCFGVAGTLGFALWGSDLRSEPVLSKWFLAFHLEINRRFQRVIDLIMIEQILIVGQKNIVVNATMWYRSNNSITSLFV